MDGWWIECGVLMLLPQQLDWNQARTRWKAILDVLLGNPSLNSQILDNVALANGTTTVNHGLGRTLTGWRVIRINGAATIYDKQDTNSMPDLTLILTSSAAVIVSLEVF